MTSQFLLELLQQMSLKVIVACESPRNLTIFQKSKSWTSKTYFAFIFYKHKIICKRKTHKPAKEFSCKQKLIKIYIKLKIITISVSSIKF